MKPELLQGQNGHPARFAILADRLKAAYAAYGIRLRPYHDSSLPLFSVLPAEHQKMVLAALDSTLDLYAEMERNGERLDDSPKLLWRAINRMGLRPRSDVFDKIDKEDVVEIYTDTNIQVFRNLNFFRYVSITLEELCSQAFHEHAELDPAAGEYYLTLGPRMRSNDLKETFPSPLKPYRARELTGDKLQMELTPRWISPVFLGEQCAGIISILSCRLI